jgi:hypothetical protein
MAAPALNPIPAKLVDMVVEAHIRFEVKKTCCGVLATRASRIEILAEKIRVALNAYTTPGRMDEARKLFNGPVVMRVVFGLPDLPAVSDATRDTFSEMALRSSLRDWGLRGVAYIEDYLFEGGHEAIKALLDNAENANVTFAPAPGEKHRAFIMTSTEAGTGIYAW